MDGGESAISGRYRRTDESYVDSVFDRLRQGLHCSLGCGGAKCKHEDWDYFLKHREGLPPPAIEGLNSAWVTDRVIASQRPSTSLFLKYVLIQQFKAKGVTAVFNLQEKGEHSSCGPDGVYASSGYSYNGEEDLMRHGIHYYEFPWPDMTAPDHDIVLRSVQVMDYHIRGGGKVLVHCHAGLGRTGLMIACFLIYSSRMSAPDAVSLLRTKRPGAVQTSRQVEFVVEFEHHLRSLVKAFRVDVSDPLVELNAFMIRQRKCMHGDEGEIYRRVPRVIHELLCRLLALVGSDRSRAREAIESFAPSAAPDRATLRQLRLLANESSLPLEKILSVKECAFMAIDWFRSIASPVLPLDCADALAAHMLTFEPERRPLLDVVSEVLNRAERHTIEMMCSVIFILCEGQADGLRRFACKCLVEALTHAHNPLKSLQSPQQRDLLNEFIYGWIDVVQGSYFASSPTLGDHVHLISTASRRHLEVGIANPLKPVEPQPLETP